MGDTGLLFIFLISAAGFAAVAHGHWHLSWLGSFITLIVIFGILFWKMTHRERN